MNPATKELQARVYDRIEEIPLPLLIQLATVEQLERIADELASMRDPTKGSGVLVWNI